MCEFLVKYVLIFFNFIFVIIGGAILGLGIFIYLQIGGENILPVDIEVLPIAIIIIGSVLFLISFSGCCGAITESRCLIIAYACFMFILAAVKIGIVVTLFTQMPSYQSKIESFVNTSFNDPGFNTSFHALETLLKCCGTTGPDSYNTNLGYLPPTCCAKFPSCVEEGESNLEACLCEKDDAYEQGCSTAAADFFKTVGEDIGYGIIIIIVIEVVAMVCALYFTSILNKKHKK